MRLLQLNIWGGRLFLQIMQLIGELNPDILCLQEVYGSKNELTIETDAKYLRSLQKIQAVNGYEHVYFSPAVSTTFADMEVGWGNAIISKFPLLDTRTVFTNGSYLARYDPATYVHNTRNLQIARVQLPDRSFFIANHHAHYETERLGNELSVERMTRVREELQKLPPPIILAGDLNVIAASPAMRVFDGFLEDLTATHSIPSTLSSLGKVSDVACDHILISPEIRVQNYYVADELVSDHKAVVLDFEFQNQG